MISRLPLLPLALLLAGCGIADASRPQSGSRETDTKEPSKDKSPPETKAKGKSVGEKMAEKAAKKPAPSQ
jgi:hypothetical protein